MGIPATLSQVPDSTPYIQYVAASNQTVFPYPFPITQDSDLVVVANGVTLSTDAGYTVTGVGNAAGGNITFSVGRAANDVITLFRDIPIERITQIGQNSGFSSTAFNAEFNNIYLLLQQLKNALGFALTIPTTNSPTPTTQLTPTSYANMYLAFDANGNPVPAVLSSSGALTPALVGQFAGGAKTAAEGAAGVSIVNYAYPPGYVDRYGANTVPGTTNMQTAIAAALAQAVQSGGAPVVFLPGLQYFCGTLSSLSTNVFNLVSPTNLTIYGNGAQIRTTTTITSGVGQPQIFFIKDPNNVRIYNLGCYDTGYDPTQTWKGPDFLTFTTTTATDCSGVTVQDCFFQNVVNPVSFTDVGGGSGRIRGIKLSGNVHYNTYYGPNFQEQGDGAEVDAFCYNCLRAYFPYGVSGHNVSLHIYHDGTSQGSNACIVIDRHANDTRDIKVRADFHGYTTQYGNLLHFESQSTSGTLGVTALGSITAGTGGTAGVYWGVPLTGGSGTGATAQVTVGSGGGVVDVQISNPGKGYVSGDSLSAASANIGSCSGFAVSVSGAGGVVDGVDVDLHVVDAQVAANTNPPGIEFRSLDADGAVQTTTADRWDRITIRGNFGQFPPQQQGQAYPILVSSTQTGAAGRLSVGADLFDAFDYQNQGYPGFILKLSNNRYAITKTGDLTAAAINVDLSKYRNRTWAFRLYIAAESNFGTSVSSNQYVEQFIQGQLTAAGAAQINNSTNIVSQTNGTASVVSFDVSGTNLTISFTNYSASQAYVRVIVEDMLKLL